MNPDIYDRNTMEFRDALDAEQERNAEINAGLCKGEPLSRGGSDTLDLGECHYTSQTEGATPSTFDLDREIAHQRKRGYETFTDYLSRTGFPNDEDSYSAWIKEGRWMITSEDKPLDKTPVQIQNETFSKILDHFS